MPYRRMNTARWGEAWWEALTAPEKLVYWYLESNDRCPACGIYVVTYKRISQETDLPESQVEKAMMALQPHIMYDKRINLVFIRRFVRDQRSSSNWMISVQRALNEIQPHPFVKEFLQVNHIFKIDYTKAMDSLCIGTDTNTILNSLSLDFKGEGSKEGGKPPREPKVTEAPAPQEDEKKRFRDWVYMTETQHQDLLDKYGAVRVDLEILKLDNYMEQTEKKRPGGKEEYKNHYKVIVTWIEGDQKGKGRVDEKRNGLAKGEVDYGAFRAGGGHGGS